MSRKRSKKKKTASAEAPRAKKGKQKTHVPRKDKGGKKSPPWLIPLLVFVGLALFAALAIVASSATPTK